MANINFNNIYRRANEEHSAVDKSLVTRHSDVDRETFSDIKFDIKIKEITERPWNSKENDNDIQKLVDEESVTQSIRNVINTIGNTRLLNPEMDIDISSFLFEPINQHTAYFIGYVIKTKIPAYEPRVVVDNVKVIGHPTEMCYEVFISASIPELKKSINLALILKEENII